MSAQVTDNLPLLAGAPNGLKKLRELILELAVRGKLVPQDPNDEPASELLKRIAEEKVRLVAEGKLKKQKPLENIDEEEKPFEVSEQWQWVRLGEIAEIIRGVTYSKSDASNTPLPEYAPLLRGNNINRTLNFDSPVFVPQKLISDHQHIQAGDIVIAMSSGSADLVGKAAQATTSFAGSFGAFCGVVRSRTSDLCQYFGFFFQTPFYRSRAAGHGKGIGINNLQKSALEKLAIPIPPLAEQHRIVAKVDELIALCDCLQAKQADAESAHAQLVQALLDSLTQAADADDFAQSWQRLAEHFHTLFTTESSIDALKQTLLQLAVMGKLVPQDPNDEPASELLKRIAEEKARLVAEGKLKKQKPLAAITEADLLFPLPNGWVFSRIGELALSTEYGLSEKTTDLKEGIPVLKMGDIQEGQVLLGGQMKVSPNVEGLPELYLQPEDLLYNRTNSAELVGKTGIYLGSPDEYTFASYLIRIRCLKELFSPKYLNISMNTPVFRETQINPHLKQQCGQANVNGTIMKNMVVSVPPLAEQHRIVAKVDQLMALCDQLKQRLTQARTLHEQLANTLVEQAVA